MDKLIINFTETTPQVNFDPGLGLLAIEGRVIPEDVGSFFSPIFYWIEKFEPDVNKPYVLRFCLFYYNTSSSKRIFEVMKRFDEKFQNGGNIKIRWEYEDGDDDTFQDGEDYKKMLKIPFEIIKV